MNAEQTAAENNAHAAANAVEQTAAVAGNILLAINAYADLTKRFNKEMAWQNNVTAYLTRKAAGSFPNAEPKGMPSKAHKHQMYADASRLMHILKLDVARPDSLPGIAAVIAAATAVLMAR